MSTPLPVHIPANTSGQSNIDWLSLVMSNISHGVVIENTDGEIINISNELLSTFGAAFTSADLIGKKSNVLWNLISTLCDNEELLHEVNSLTQDKLKKSSIELLFKTGEVLLLSCVPLFQENAFKGHLWQFQNGTPKPKEVAVLEEQRKFYLDVLDSIPSDIAVFSPEHRYLYINPVGLKDPETRKWLIGKDDFEYCEKRGKDISFAQNRREIFNEIIASGKEKEWEESMINKDGEVEHHLRRLRPIFNEKNELLWIIGYGLNITERKRFEKQIQLSEKRYRDLFDYSQAIICTHDMQGNFLTANPALLEVMGYEEHEIIGKSIREFLFEDDRKAFNDLYLPSLKQNNKVKGIFKVIHKNGSKIYLLYQNYRVEESSQDDAYIIAFAQDITDRVKAEKELKIAKKVTEETARNKEKFLANMSHEIRTPMNGIIGITSFLQKTEVNKEQKDYLNIIQESANDLLTIINDILDLEKIGTGQIQLENIPFDIVAKTNTVIRLFEITAKNKGIDIIFKNDLGENFIVVGDPTRFYQVMNNLISNAVKFTHQGGITINASREAESNTETTLRFSVEDTGIGIDTTNLKKIFQPFTQAYPETTRMYGGTGLGLAITKNLLELQGGNIWVESVPKKGSSFNFTITYRKSDSKEVLNQPVKRIKNKFPGLRILVAEDNEINQMLTTNMLQQLDFEATAVSNGVEVLEMINQADFDLVLMDIQMPQMNGYEATKKIRCLSNNKASIPIIALTANALKGEEENYTLAGMNGYLTKPFTEAALYEVISNVITQHQYSINQNNQIMSQSQQAEKLYDLSLVSELARGNQEFIINLAKIFIDTVPPTASEMVKACEEKKWEQMGKLAHKLKSTIDTMCINTLKDDIRAIEKNGKDQKNLDITPALVEKADSIIRQVTQQLKSEFNL